MLSASFTSLLLPGIEFATAPGYVPVSVGGVELVGIWPVLIGFAASVILLDRGDAWVPQVQRVITGRREFDPGEQARVGSVVLFIVAITLHNMPEGLAVSIAARSAGLGSLFYATVAGVRAGLVEIPLAVFGAVAVAVAAPVLPYAMGLAAGGMLFVISHEIVPQIHARGNEHVATVGLMIGVVVMLYLDVTLA